MGISRVYIGIMENRNYYGILGCICIGGYIGII